MGHEEIFPHQGLILQGIIQDRSIVGQRQMVARRSNGFIIKIKGKTEYCFPKETLLLEEGQILFIKKSSSYSIREVEPGYSYVVNFDGTSENSRTTRLSFPDGTDISVEAEKMHRCWQKENVYGALSKLYGLLEKSTSSPQGYVSAQDRKRLETVEYFLNQNLTNPDLTSEALRSVSGVSAAYFRRIFKKRFGLSPVEYILKERIRLARRLLTENEKKTVSEISVSVGFRDPLYFSRVFKKQMGISPDHYRKEQAGDLF